MSQINKLLLAAIAAAAIGAGGAQAKPVPRGGNCTNPWRAVYAHGKVTGDIGKVSLVVAVKGRQISVSWHAVGGYRFCSLTLVEGRGSIFRSTNPNATYRYTDATSDRSNGIRTLSANARSAR